MSCMILHSNAWRYEELSSILITSKFRFQSLLSNKDNNGAVMTVMEDLVRSGLGDKSVTVPDITDDASDNISDSKVEHMCILRESSYWKPFQLQFLEPCWLQSPFPTQGVVKRISQETWLSEEQIINWYVQRNKAEIASIVM